VTSQSIGMMKEHRLMLILLALSVSSCKAEMEGSDNVQTSLDDDIKIIFDIDENKEKVDTEDIVTDENKDKDKMLPRSEKSLLGTFPTHGHGISYNPRARQPLTRNHGQPVQHHATHHIQQPSDFDVYNSHDDHHRQGYPFTQGSYNQHQHQEEEVQSLQFPFKRLDSLNQLNQYNNDQPHPNGIIRNDEILTALEKATINELEVLEVDEEGRKCVNKVMMREETEYDEVLTCDHSYDNRCHTSYVTRYEPHQEEECEEKFRKVCTIDYEQKANQELVEVCTSSFIPDCDVKGEPECKTMWSSECSTVQIIHEVEDDVANCETIEEEKCEDVTDGFSTQRKCDTWPKEKCTLEKKKVKKYTPQTSCRKVPKEACSPPGCGVKEGPVTCQEKVKTVISDNPVEDCDMEPLRTCKHITKLVPKLESVQECVDVPKEICARSKINPKKVQKPSIQKWCFTPSPTQA